MIIGVPRETKTDEYRAAMLPIGARLLTQDGHTVLVEKGAGAGSGTHDAAYEAAGARLTDGPGALFAEAEMIVKVKEPQPEEVAMLREEQIVFCYFHFAGSRKLTEGCLDQRIAAVAFETLTDRRGGLPLLTPMSEVAGKMSIQQGAKCLENPMMGRGVLLGGVAGVRPATVLIIGGGVVGSNAAQVAAGLGADVVVMDINLDRLRYLDDVMPANVTTVYSDPGAIEHYAGQADLVVGAVLIPGAKAPVVIDRATLRRMKERAVLVDVSIDQGGCFETSHPTTHSDPVFLTEGVVHYCVTNIPGAVGRTSSQALCNASLPYCRQLARLGLDGFIGQGEGFANALNLRDGSIFCDAVAEAFPDLPRA